MEEARFWDIAVKGSSALRASVVRLVKDECVALADAEYATILWDVEKFYDNMPMTGLARASREIGFPAIIMHQCMLMYMAARIC